MSKNQPPQDARMDYFYGDEAEQFTYFRIPRLLITSQRFKGLSTEAKLLYGMMLDRMGLSMKNGWHEEDGRVFIYYSIDEICKDLNCASEKAVKLLAELEDSSQVKYRCIRAREMDNGDVIEENRKQTILHEAGLEIGGLYPLRPGKLYRVVGIVNEQERIGIRLIERKRQGQGKPTKIYVKRFTTREVPIRDLAENTSCLPRDEGLQQNGLEFQNFDSQNSRNSIIENQEFRQSKNKDFDNRNSRNPIIENQEFRLSKGNNTEYSNTDNSYPYSVNPSIKPSTENLARARAEGDGRMDGRAVRESIKKQIEYDILPYRDITPWQLRQADELLELMVEVALTQSPSIQIGQGSYPADYVKERFAKIRCEHIEQVLIGLSENEGRVVNVRAYMLASLFNATATLDNAVALSADLAFG